MINLKKVFALDVGTRNVVGLLTEHYNGIELKDAVTIEHETRAMEDGQIHDISKVTKTVLRVKKELEKRNNIELKDVAVAVAGRELLTEDGIAKKEINIQNEISEEDILAIELLAIQNSLNKLNKTNNGYHCVGYTVTEYKLDGEIIKNPLFQKGKELEVEILATFLPKIVVESMFTMARKANLNIINMTLEPIAAINVVIPKDMRKLNLALVDIGAGTSDIAITKDGKVIGYGMVPMAGDEITEEIEKEYLLEFHEADKIKRHLTEEGETVKYTDVLGFENELSKADIINSIKKTSEELSQKIVNRIIEINGKIPQAVIMIGGGSLTPKLSEKVAEKISLPKNRVAVRGTESIKVLRDEKKLLNGAEFVTPVGIANMAVEGKGFKIIPVVIDGEEYRVFSFKNKITLMDSLLAAGVNSKKLYSKSGAPLTLKINSKLKIVRGEIGKQAIIRVNGEIKNLDEEIKKDSVVDIKYPRDGRNAVYKLEELYTEYENLEIKINSEDYNLKPKVMINSEIKGEDYSFLDRDEVEVIEKYHINELLEKLNLKNIELKFYLNDKKMEIPVSNIIVKKDGKEIALTTEIKSGDSYIIENDNKEEATLEKILDFGLEEEIIVTVNDKKVNLGKAKGEVKKDGEKLSLNYKIKSGDVLEYIEAKENLPIVSDIFKEHNPEDFVSKKGGLIKIKVNGKEGNFTTKLRNKDVLKIYYD